jgi:hypothetical protein
MGLTLMQQWTRGAPAATTFFRAIMQLQYY